MKSFSQKQIDDFVKRQMYCPYCINVQNELKTKNLDDCNKYLNSYKGMICGALEGLLFFDENYE